MHLVHAATISALVLSGLAGAAVTANTPGALTECEPVLLSWSGGTAPYYPKINQAGSQTVTLESLATTSDTSITWTVNQASGISITFAVTDSTGYTGYSAESPSISSGSSSCLSSTSSGSSSSTSGSSSSTSSAAPGSTTSAATASSSTSGTSAGSSSSSSSASTTTTSSGSSSDSAATIRGFAAVAAGVVGVFVAVLS